VPSAMLESSRKRVAMTSEADVVVVAAEVDEVEKVTFQDLQDPWEVREGEAKMEAVEADGGDVLDDSLCTEIVVFWCMDPT